MHWIIGAALYPICCVPLSRSFLTSWIPDSFLPALIESWVSVSVTIFPLEEGHLLKDFFSCYH
jgi:hypothetical protein